jgi:hypothetical protein
VEVEERRRGWSWKERREVKGRLRMSREREEKMGGGCSKYASLVVLLTLEQDHASFIS